MGFWKRRGFALTTFTLQSLFLILFALFSDYRYNLEVEKTWFYPMFQNVHVMMFVGFGFLMTFLKKYGYSAVSINFLIAAMVLQWHIIFKGLIHLKHEGAINIGLVDLISADFTSAAVLISFGAVIGKTTPMQLLTMGFLEVMVFAGNEYIAVEIFEAVDVGGSMVVHVFGAYFGLAVARVLYQPEHTTSSNESSSYQSDIFSMIGTVFLWLYWPSFNSAVAGSETQQIRAIINTYLALASCVLITFAISSLTDRRARFNMVHIQNATLAGGVAVGTSANFMLHPWGAVLIGCLAATISVIGFQYLQEFLVKRIGLHDSCGVHNLHGMPGILAAIIGAVAVTFANLSTYGNELYEVFPLPDPALNETMRTANEQAAYQAATLGVTLGLSLCGGLITGAVLRFLPGVDEENLYADNKYFQVADDLELSREEIDIEVDARMKKCDSSLLPSADSKL